MAKMFILIATVVSMTIFVTFLMPKIYLGDNYNLYAVGYMSGYFVAKFLDWMPNKILKRGNNHEKA